MTKVQPTKEISGKPAQNHLMISKPIELMWSKTNQIRIDKNGDVCLTDMVACFPEKRLDEWLSNKNTIEFLSVWEKKHNHNFTDISNIGNSLCLNNANDLQVIDKPGNSRVFKMGSVKEWVKSTNAIGIKAKAGKGGGTFTHRHIAFEFAMWLSAEFKLWMIEDYERRTIMQQDWDINRYMSKVGYRTQTDAIKDTICIDLPPEKHRGEYAQEANMLNVLVFGKEAKGVNPRESATKEQLELLATLEFKNGTLIDAGLDRPTRISALSDVVKKYRTKHLLN